MTIANYNVPRERFTLAIESGHAPHLNPIMAAVRDHGVGFCIVPQGQHTFGPPSCRPNILIIGDDLWTAQGPTAFHQQSLRRYIRRCAAAVIVSSEPLVEAYAAATVPAIIAGSDVLLVETRLEHEETWRRFIVGHKPDIAMLICTVQPEGGVQ